MSQQPRYEVLDALRGVAAVCVVIHHMGGRLTPFLLPHAYLAVDLFFVLSGFVIAGAYEDKLRRRMTVRQFVYRRLIRLYPLSLLGVALGLGVLLCKYFLFAGRGDGPFSLLISAAFNALFLPSFFSGPASRGGDLFQDQPLWSLFFELLVNVAWAWVGIRLSTRWLFAIAAVSLAALAFFGTLFGTVALGYSVDTFWGGFPRVFFGFFMGAALFRIHDKIAPAMLHIGWIGLCLIVIGLFAVPGDPIVGDLPIYDLVCLSLILPGIVAIGAAPAAAGPVARWLGALSYPLYAIHFPFLVAAYGLKESFSSRFGSYAAPAVALLAAGAASLLALRFYDRPVRAALTRWQSRSAGSSPIVEHAVGD